MPRSSRLFLLLPLLATLALPALPGLAQQPPPVSARYAFADTTLLRDTLGIHFDGLFPIADSLQMTPDTLRALMIRYRFVMPRILHLADSLGVPVDSVGPVMFRARFNPLAGPGGQRVAFTEFTWTSGYDIQRTSTTWTNGSQYRVQRGPYYATNGTSIELQRITSGGALSLRQSRDATTEAGLTLSRQLSLGARSHQLRFFSSDPGSASDQQEAKDEYGFTGHAMAGGRASSGELNVNSGYLDDRSSVQVKRGLSASADARLKFARGNSLTHDLSGSVTGNAARTRQANTVYELNTQDLSSNLRGTLAVMANAPVGLNLTYGLRNTRVETPVDTVRINRIRTRNNNLDATLRMRRDNDRYLNLSATVARTGSSTGTRDDAGGRATLRWAIAGWALDANYSDNRGTSVYLRQRGGGGYDDESVTRATDGSLVRNFGSRFVAKVIGSVNLDRHRYVARADSAVLPTPRDGYRQSYRGEMLYNPSPKMSSGVVLEVSLARTINLPASTTGSNNDTREYRGEWRWTYRMFQSFTVTQNNALVADYQNYPFAPANNKLGLNFNTSTSLSARLPGNLSIDVQHNSSQQPRGSYLRQSDGLSYLQLSDDSRNYTLNTALRYQPGQAIGLHVEPRYLAYDRTGTVNGVQAKQSANRRLDFSGGVDLNLRVGTKGQLSGRLSRTYTDQRAVNYQNGVALPSTPSQDDYWNGSLQLSWQL